jgi:predicted Zn-dependent peptidase
VPAAAVYMAFRTPARLEPDFYPLDLISDILAQGHSSRLYRHLLKERRLFSTIDAYVTANIDPGLLVIEGRPADGVSMDDAIAAIWEELDALKAAPIDQRELDKIKHRFESTIVFSEMSAMNKAQNLAFYEMLDRAELMNEEVDTYMKVSADDLHRVANELFIKENSATLIYQPATRQ